MSELVQRDLNWARKITERLRLQTTNYQEAREKVIATLVEARDGGAAELLGYASWTAYMADVLGDAPLRLERDARQELVAELHEAGMSTRAIAPIVGVDNATVHRDIGRVADATPAVTRIEYRQEQHPDGDWSREIGPVGVDVATGEVVDAPQQKVTGLDGKQYSRPEPKPKAEAATSQFSSAVADLNRLLDRFHRLTESEAFRRNANTISALHRADINRAIDELTQLADAL